MTLLWGTGGGGGITPHVTLNNKDYCIGSWHRNPRWPQSDRRGPIYERAQLTIAYGSRSGQKWGSLPRHIPVLNIYVRYWKLEMSWIWTWLYIAKYTAQRGRWIIIVFKINRMKISLWSLESMGLHHVHLCKLKLHGGTVGIDNVLGGGGGEREIEEPGEEVYSWLWSDPKLKLDAR